MGEERDVQGEPPFKPPPRLMRLFTHLVISHTVPVLVVTLALGVLLTALVRISLVLTTLNEEELVVLRDEGALHRSAWALDVALRHGQADCAAGAASSDVAASIGPKADALRTLTEGAAPGAIRELARGYLNTATQVVSGDTCRQLAGAAVQARRNELDEQLTNAWVDRLDELHAAVTAKDGDARNMAVSASWMGVPLAAISFLLAMLIARRMASVVNRPLASLASMAERVGQGDFQTSVEVEGPTEVLALAEELERMRAQLQQLETLKQGFLASVSHELRTPLSKIREALTLLEDGAVGASDPRQQRVIQIARNACEREIRMVTTLLDLSRLRSGSPIQIREGITLDRVLHTAINEERTDAHARGVEVEVVTRGDSPVGPLDPMLVERAIANLIRNAVAVSASGQRVFVERRVENGAPDRPGCWARITVMDEGPGVPEEIRERVFDAFVTQSVPSSGKALGVGLGLALAREVAQAHGGHLELLEANGKGSTFQMWLPMDDAPTMPSTPGAPLAEPAGYGIMGVRQ
jgi:two-component system, NtrC family, sensor histidine kinase GlrK